MAHTVMADQEEPIVKNRSGLPSHPKHQMVFSPHNNFNLKYHLSSSCFCSFVFIHSFSSRDSCDPFECAGGWEKKKRYHIISAS